MDRKTENNEQSAYKNLNDETVKQDLRVTKEIAAAFHLHWTFTIISQMMPFNMRLINTFCSKATEKTFQHLVQQEKSNEVSDRKEKRKYWVRWIACFISIVDNNSTAMLCDTVGKNGKMFSIFLLFLFFFPAKQSKENGSIGAYTYFNWMAPLLFSVFRWFEYVEFPLIHWKECHVYPKNVQYLLCSQLFIYSDKSMFVFKLPYATT